ncbi:GNAT family N-acetyltransferase [Actinoplanes derwentensis]|uniref:GNAT family N-acetyltransferase n=1 Tax=Actinoplanes derwentensis TaxID=113562 RepID=UPI0018D47BBB|nr:GNAT family N-acetyltransferase [Actinoplanes derwentensis]
MASADEVRLIAGWVAAEGWYPGDGDETILHVADPGGFLVGRLDGQPITSISAVRQGSERGFLGLHLTIPEFRGQGYGQRIWQAGMSRLTGRVVGLDGTVAQQENFRKSGFRDAWLTVRYQGELSGAQRTAGLEIADARSVGFDELARYDRRFFPAERDAFLSLWITTSGRRAVVARRAGSVVGFAVRRPAGDVDRIGPLFADSPEIAESLLAALAESVGGAVPVLLDVPSVNRPANELAERAGLKESSRTTRMYTGDAPETGRAGIYGVTTLELG